MSTPVAACAKLPPDPLLDSVAKFQLWIEFRHRIQRRIHPHKTAAAVPIDSYAGGSLSGVDLRLWAAMASVSCAMELARGAVKGGVAGLPGMAPVSMPVSVPVPARVGVKAGRLASGGQRTSGVVAVRAAASERVSEVSAEGLSEGGVVRGVLFDMDGVLCDSEHCSRKAGAEMFAEMGYTVEEDDFIPFMGTGEANFLSGVAKKHGVPDFDVILAKKRFFQIYVEKFATPDSGLGYPGALDLILQCKEAGLKTAVASSADRVKVDANLAAAGFPQSNFDAIISADLFVNLKPAPDIFLAAAKNLGLQPHECVVIEDATAGVQAARAAGMRCISVTTTLSEEKLMESEPQLVRKDISYISLKDIQELDARRPDHSESPGGTVKDVNVSVSKGYQGALNAEVPLPGGYFTTRREVLKLGSLAMGIGSSYFALTHLKALSYASPKALLNALQGVGQPLLANGSELARPERVRQFKQYIRELESKKTGQTVQDFQPKLEWLNTSPLSLKKDLKGKVVVLDFWTYCCINCMHVLPDLAYLENKYRGQPMTVVGVHSAKFDNEKDSGAIRNAVLRYDVTHPVVNDGEMTMWRQLGVSSWPTLAVVSPNGRLVAMLSGEGHREDLDDLVEAALEFYGEKKLLDSRPLIPSLEKDKDSRLVASPLKFPGKLATDLVNGRLFISDSNHHRIVVTDLDGNFLTQVGGGGEGLKDGAFADALFNRPQGVAYNAVKNVLYVADTENHALREVDFVRETVRTLAGNGTKGTDYKGGKKGSAQVLNSPWDVAHDAEDGLVYIALAGQHQIWRHKISDGTTGVFSGDGYERNLNGRRGTETSFAQPSGISLTPDLKSMYLADSESSSIRRVDLTTGGSKLLAGGDPTFSDNLFQFGDKDGVGSSAQLQHPLGVLHSPEGLVYVADSYNHKIKVLDPKTQKVTTLAGTGTAGFKDGAAQAGQLSEPAGIAMGLDGKLYVADTNNSLVRVLDLQAQGGPKLATLELKGVLPPTPAAPAGPRRLRQRLSSDTQVIRIDPVDALNGDLQLQILLASGYHFSKEAQSKYEVEVETDSGITLDPPTGTIGQDGTAIIHFKRDPNSASQNATRVSCKVYFCEEDQVCLYKALAFDIPFSSEVASDKARRVTLPALVKPAEVARKSFTGKV